MRVAIVGGTGFVGSYIVESLLDAGHEVSVLVRPGSESKLLRAGDVRVVSGNIDAPEALDELAREVVPVFPAIDLDPLT